MTLKPPRRRITLSDKRGTIRQDDKRKIVNLDDKRSKVHLNIDVEEEVNEGIFDETFDLSFE